MRSRRERSLQRVAFDLRRRTCRAPATAPDTLLRVTRGYAAARRFLDSPEATARLDRRFVNEELERRALVILERYRDHDFSNVDATTFALMRDARIRHAFAFDAHFPTAGFMRVPVDISADQLRS